MFKLLFGFEINYHSKQKAFLWLSILFLALGFMKGNANHISSNVSINAAYQINYNTISSIMFCTLVIMFFVISGVLRDKQYQIEPIVYSTAIKKSSFFISRFLGVYVFSLVTLTMSLIGFALGIGFTNVAPKYVAEFNLGNYLWVWMLFIVPNVFIFSSILFSIALVTKNTFATYTSAIIIYLLYWACSIYFNSPMLVQSSPVSPETMAVGALVDPFGIYAFFEQTQYWTPFQKNNQSISLSGNFLWNRIVWCVLSIGLLLWSYNLFSFRKEHTKKKVKEFATIPESYTGRYQPIYHLNHKLKGQFLSFTSVLKIELINVFKSLSFMAILLIWVALLVIQIYSWIDEGGVYNDSFYPTTDLMIYLIGMLKYPLPFLSLVLIILYSGELIWREHSLKFNSIIGGTPTTNSVFFLAKGIAIFLVPIVLIVVSILVAMMLQVSKGYYNFEITQYFKMFYFQAIPLFFYTLLALFVQSVCTNKYVGMFITTLIIVVFGTPLITQFGLEHPLFKIGALPNVHYTNMTGYSSSIKAFHHFALYWSFFGLLLALLSFKIWQRGTVYQFSFKIKQLFMNWKPWQRLSLVVLVLLFIGFGTQIFYNTNIINNYKTIEESLSQRVDYERKYKQYETLDRLYPTTINTKVDLYPQERSYKITADYVLKNKGNNAVSKVFITQRTPLKSIYLENAELIEKDSVLGTYVFHFKEKVLPEQEVIFKFSIEKKYKGYENNKVVLPNGSYLTHQDFDPVLGYMSGRELSDNVERVKRNLPEIEVEEITDEHLKNHQISYGKVVYESIVSTQSNETAITSGDLLRKWTQNDRNYFHFKAKEKIIPSIAYFSSNYTIKTENYKGIQVEQYYNEEHQFNIDTIQKSMKETLAYCTENFGQYPFNHLRIVEIPSHWTFGGFAHPGVISMVENKLYLSDISNTKGFNLVTKRTIHEVAHQWWGHILSPKFVEGASLFTEGLAKYTEAVIMEKMYGKSAIYQLSQSANSRYFRGRSYASNQELPLYLNNEQSYLTYGKNYTVMLALRDILGEQLLNKVLKELLNKYRNSTEFEITSLDFLNALYKVTPEEYHVLINDWLKRIIRYDLSVKETSHSKLSNGMYEVTLKVQAKRFKMQSTGEEISTAINEHINIGIFREHPSELISSKSILYLKPHQINKERMEFKILIKELPKFIAIDPFGTRSDQNLADNIVKL
ncbi:M1 family aminopeptidase [uncultured Tenacibaculum sp.]|uniref:M1 family aminopeptidase n=1 Tax=uncultured Tenacibaculum sp. TaxID=174713 RepID=UPI0026147848|nr:M1 family aminopeptidase [uncultured Tenacibaculum sp.]